MSMYNAACYLRECIDSVLHQTFTDFEFIIVDDGSTDNSVEIVKSYDDSRIKLILNGHDYIDSLNKSIEEASGTYIARMDADDVMMPNRLETQIHFMEKHPDIGILSGSIALISAEGKDSGRSMCDREGYVTLEDMINGCCIAHPTVMMRMACIDHYKYALYDKHFSYAEDYALWVKLLMTGVAFYNMKDTFGLYRLHPEQVSSQKTNEQSSKSVLIREKAIAYHNFLINKAFNDKPSIQQTTKELTVVIPFLNEREEVRNTVQSIRDTVGDAVDIIVINDKSDNDYDYQSDLTGLNVTYIENSYRIGAALSKEKGIQLVRSPYFLLLDAHMRFYDTHWPTFIVSELKKNPDRLLCSQSISLSKDESGIVQKSTRPSNTSGAYLCYGHSHYVPGIKWNYSCKDFSDQSIHQIPCVFGAGYASSKAYWNKLKGFQGLIHYGCEEAYISIKAWREGGGCYVLPNLNIGHIYRKKFPYIVHTTQHAYNYMFIAETLFPTSEKCYAKAVAWKVHPATFLKIQTYIQSNRESIEAFRNYFNHWSGRHYEWIKAMNEQCRKTEEKQMRITSDEMTSVIAKLTSEDIVTNNLGLLSGLTAQFICLLIYVSKYPAETILEDRISMLWSRLTVALSDPVSVFFDKGIAGIGWGLIYASSHQLIEDDIQDELTLIDKQINRISIKRTDDTSLLTGVGGIYCYVVARLGYNKRNNFPDSFNPDFIAELEHCAPAVIAVTKDWRTMNFVMQFMERNEADWEILPPEFREIAELPDYVPLQSIDWEYSLTGVIGSVINKLL